MDGSLRQRVIQLENCKWRDLSAQTTYTQSHKTARGTVQLQRQLPEATEAKAVRTAAPAVCLDISTLEFCNVQQAMRQYARTVFEIGQTVPANVSIDPSSYLPKKFLSLMQ